MKLLGVRVPESLIERVKIRAVKEKSTLQELVEIALEAYLRRPLKRKEEGR
jgi:predicted DNA binding CopG/RHH family protein